MRAGSISDAARRTWDLRALERLDYIGAQVLWNAWGHQWPACLLTTDAQRARLERIAKHAIPPPVASRRSAWQLFLELGSQV